MNSKEKYFLSIKQISIWQAIANSSLSMKLATECEINIQCIRKRIERSNVRTSCRFTPSAHGFVYTFLVCCKRKYNFCLCYRVDAKKIKVVNAQINLPKLHTKYQSIHTLSKNSHVDDRWFQTQTATLRQWYVLRRWTSRISKYLLCSAPLWPLPLVRADDNVLK